MDEDFRSPDGNDRAYFQTSTTVIRRPAKTTGRANPTREATSVSAWTAGWVLTVMVNFSLEKKKEESDYLSTTQRKNR